nr:hypothetical protein [Pseudooctadecabacter jejudonensis]
MSGFAVVGVDVFEHTAQADDLCCGGDFFAYFAQHGVRRPFAKFDSAAQGAPAFDAAIVVSNGAGQKAIVAPCHRQRFDAHTRSGSAVGLNRGAVIGHGLG